MIDQSSAKQAVQRLAIVALGIFTAIAMPLAHAQGQGRSPNQEILDRLDSIEAKIDALAGEQVTATFCISQGRELGLGADWIVTADTEWEAGAGWAEVFSGEATAEVKIPAGPIPSETAINVAGSHGRNFNICVDLPLEMGPTDTALLAELAAAINSKADDFPNRGKFQRRAHRLLNYTKRRVPGVQTRTIMEPAFAGNIAAEEPDGAEDEFDRMDEAVGNLLAGGLAGDGTPLGFLRNADLRNVVTSFGELPSNITMMVDDPEQLWNPLSDAISNGGIDNMRCETFGLDAGVRNQKPGLNNLCTRLESFPEFAQVESILSGELIGELFEALDTLTISSNAAAVSQNSRSRFCSTRVGQRPRFDNFCGR